MTARDADETHRASTPLELLFDLTFVVAIAQVADELARSIGEGHAARGIVPFIMVFFAIWWAWLNFTWFASAYDVDDVPYRLLVFVQMAGVLVLAAGVPEAFEHQNFLAITLGYFIMRVGLVAQWVRAAVDNPDGRATAIRYAAGVTVVQVLWVSRLLLPTDAANRWWTVYLAFAVLVVLEAVVPYWAERTGGTSWHPHHIAERYGLFTIILLGETIAVLAIGNGRIITAGERMGPLLIVGIASLVLIFALWWLYFLQPSGQGLVAHRDGSYFWGYGHYFLFAGLGSLGAGLEVVMRVASGDARVSLGAAAWSVALPTCVYLGALLLTSVRILPTIRLHAWVVVPTILVTLALPLFVDRVGLEIDFAAMAVVAAAAVVATMALGRRLVGAEQ